MPKGKASFLVPQEKKDLKPNLFFFNSQEIPFSLKKIGWLGVEATMLLPTLSSGVCWGAELFGGLICSSLEARWGGFFRSWGWTAGSLIFFFKSTYNGAWVAHYSFSIGKALQALTTLAALYRKLAFSLVWVLRLFCNSKSLSLLFSLCISNT